MRHTVLGFDYIDRLLDIISADRSSWSWKDEGEVRKVLELGIFTSEQVNEFYRIGELAIRSIRTNDPPFDGNWEKWEPDPAWRELLKVPHGWERV